MKLGKISSRVNPSEGLGLSFEERTSKEYRKEEWWARPMA